MRLSPCVLVQPDGWARGEREGYGEPCDVTSLSLLLAGKRSTALAGALPRAVPRGAMTQDHRINYLVVVGMAGGNVSSMAA